MHIQKIARLKEKKHRKDTGCFLVEGDKAVAETIAVHDVRGTWEVRHVYCTQTFVSSHLEELQKKRIPFSVVDAGELAKAGTFEVNDGAIAVVNMPRSGVASSEQRVVRTSNPPLLTASSEVILALDGIKDPGNLGTIIRTADWFGVTEVLLGTDTVDVYNPKCIAATMGSFLRVRTQQTELYDTLQEAKKQGASVYATAMRGTPLSTVVFKKPCIIVMGSESHGVKPKLLSLADETLTIPRVGNAESLNVGVASGIILSALAV